MVCEAIPTPARATAKRPSKEITLRIGFAPRTALKIPTPVVAAPNFAVISADETAISFIAISAAITALERTNIAVARPASCGP